MNRQKNKTKIATTIFAFLIIGLGLSFPSTVIPNANAQIVNNQIIPADVGLEMIKKNAPANLSAAQLGNVKHITLSDEKVKAAINGQRFEFMAQSFLGNIKQSPIVWYPVININVNNKTDVAVEVNLTNNSVIKVETGTLIKTSSVPAAGDPSYAVDYYTGSSTISGVYATLPAPNYCCLPHESFLVNGIEYGANDSPNFACNSSYEFNDYFAQGGFDFYNNRVMFTDTSYNCVSQNSMLAYSQADPYLFEVYSTTGPHWNIVALDQYTGLAKMYTTTFTTYASTLKTSDPNTSVWWENQSTSTNWANNFGGASAQAYNAKYKDASTGTWTYWNSDSQVVYDCSGNTVTQNVMNNNLRSGNTQTWNLTNFEVWHC